MPVVTTRILEYRYELRSTPDENVALAYLLGEADRLVAMVACVEGTAALPGPRENVSGVVMLTLRRGEFADLVGMLRNESPSTSAGHAMPRSPRWPRGTSRSGKQSPGGAGRPGRQPRIRQRRRPRGTGSGRQAQLAGT